MLISGRLRVDHCGNNYQRAVSGSVCGWRRYGSVKCLDVVIETGRVKLVANDTDSRRSRHID